MSAAILQFFRGNSGQFERLIEPHLENLYRLAYRFTGKREDAEDLVQDLTIKLYKKQEDLSQVRELKPWLARSLRNLYIDSLRHRKRIPQGHLHEAGEERLNTMEDVAIATQPDADIETTQLQASLLTALDTLKEEQRELVVMHDVEGYTLNELTDVFNVPLGTLKSRLHRARQQLKAKLSNKLKCNPL